MCWFASIASLCLCFLDPFMPDPAASLPPDHPLHQRIADALGLSVEAWLAHLAKAEERFARGELVLNPVTPQERAAFQAWLQSCSSDAE